MKTVDIFVPAEFIINSRVSLFYFFLKISNEILIITGKFGAR